MILEERDYRMIPGKLGSFLTIYETFGFPVQIKHLGEPVAFFTTEIGELNHVVSMWRYEDLADRADRRARMLADPHWPGYLERIVGHIDVQSNRILVPTVYSPMK